MKDKMLDLLQRFCKMDGEIRRTYTMFFLAALLMMVYGFVKDLRWCLLGLITTAFTIYMIWNDSKVMGEIVEIRGTITDRKHRGNCTELYIDSEGETKIVLIPLLTREFNQHTELFHGRCVRHTNQATGDEIYTLYQNLRQKKKGRGR